MKKKKFCADNYFTYLVHDLEVVDMNVLRMIAKTSRRQQWDEHIRNEDIRVNLGVNSVEEAARVSRLRWFGHKQRMQSDRLPRRIMSEEVQGKRCRGRPRRRFLDSVKSDLEIRGLRLDDHTLALAQDRVLDNTMNFSFHTQHFSVVRYKVF